MFLKLTKSQKFCCGLFFSAVSVTHFLGCFCWRLGASCGNKGSMADVYDKNTFAGMMQGVLVGCLGIWYR